MTHFLFNNSSRTEIYTLSLHDALPILPAAPRQRWLRRRLPLPAGVAAAAGRREGGPSGRRPHRPREVPVHQRGQLDGDARSEEHTSELQSQSNLVCRLLLEKKKT